MSTKFRTGQKYESVVSAFYTHMGFNFIARNINYKFGEIDLIMYKDYYVFIEVKSTYKPQEAFDLLSEAKVHNIHSSVEFYCLNHDIEDYRIDYCCVIPSKHNYKIAIVRGI